MNKAPFTSIDYRRQHGFTMIELMITVTLVAILASIAAPSMRTFVMNSRVNSGSQELLRTLQTARSEAAKRQRNVVVCASANPQDTLPICAGTPIGWIMFEDTDSNWVHSNTEAVIEAHTFDPSKMYLLADGSRRVSYASTGFANPAGTVPLTQTPSTAMVVCDTRGNVDSNGGTTDAISVARGIVITNTGRARITKNLEEISTLLGSSKIDSACPPTP